MTQALINKLNIMPEKSLTPMEKNPKSEGMDFGKIFETKTNKFNNNNNKNTNNNQTSNDTKTIAQNQDITNDNKSQISSNTENEKTTELNTKTDSEKTAADNTTVIQNDTDKITQTDKPANEILPADTNAKDAENTEDVENVISEEELNIIADLIAEETTITTEEPTMYKELNTLEDPTTVFILQSQIHKTVNTLDAENADVSENNISLKAGSQNSGNTANTNSTAIFKQFDETVSKDVNLINFTQKEIPHAKSENRSTSNVISENLVKELNVEVISSQAAETESSMSDLMQNQSPQEQAARVMIQGDIKYEAVANEAVKNTAQVKPTEITPSKIIEQIAKQLDGMVNNSKLNIVLNPGTLGKVNLQLFNTKDGLTAQFTVTTQEARDMLLKGLDGLKESLLAQGVNVDGVSVKIEEADSEYNLDYTEQEGSGQQAKHQQGFKKQKDGEKDFEQLMFEVESEKNKV